MKTTGVREIAFLCTLTLSSLSLACSSLTKPPGSPTDAEAQREAEKFWPTQVTKCGDSYYRKEILPKKDNYVIYFQMRDPEIVITPNKVSEADRFNGVEWKGETSFRPKASHVWGTEKAAWYEWKPGMGNVPDLSYGMRKVSGQWKVNTEKSYISEGVTRQLVAQKSRNKAHLLSRIINPVITSAITSTPSMSVKVKRPSIPEIG